jgi:MinD-like ATPase involved in chromosome partitioning or flagellar assembly
VIAARVATLPGDPEREAGVAAALGSHPAAELVMRCVDRVELLAAVRGGGLDAVVSVGAPSWLDRECAAEAAGAGVRIVALVEDAGEADRLERLGAAVLPPATPTEELVARCATADAAPPRRLSSQPSSPRGKLFAVWGPKGAPGRTTVALELAAEFSSSEPETLLIDGDPYGGDVLQLLGVTEELPTTIWAARMAARDELDAARLAVDLRRAGPAGPILLPGLPRAELWAEISDFGWRQLLTVARASFRVTVVDVGFCLEPDHSPYPGGGGGRNESARASVAEADRVIAVCRADPVGIKQFMWEFEELTALTAPERVLVVANRVRASEQREVGTVLRRHTGKRPIAYVPERVAELGKAVRAGTPVREVRSSSEFSAAIRLLATALGAKVAPQGLLSRLGGRA